MFWEPSLILCRIPVFFALVVLLWLHRRHLQKLKLEEQNDKTKSMDFGMGFGAKKGGPEKPGKHRQLSMDLDINNPYILPGTLRGSRDSLRSLGKGLDAGDPRYGLRPGTAGSRPGTSDSQGGLAMPSGRKGSYAPSQHSNLVHSTVRDSSLYTASIRGDDESPNGSTMSMSAELLSGAQGMAMSSPAPPRMASLPKSKSNVPEIRMPSPPPASAKPGQPISLQPGQGSVERDSYVDNDGGDLRRSHQHLASHIVVDSIPQRGQAPAPLPAPVNRGPTISIIEPPQDQKGSGPKKAEIRPPSDGSHYEDDAHHNSIQFRFSTASDEGVHPEAPKPRSRDTLAPGAQDNRRLSMGFRPLPPDGTPDENAEERALRIRSFYKEYFDDSSTDHRTSYVEAPQSGSYYEEDNTRNYPPPTHQDDSAPVYDPSSDRYMIPGARPFADAPVRRAMTPPPRMPNQFHQSPRAPSSSSGRFMPPGPRSFSSQSGRFGPQSGRGPPPKKASIPPSPLQMLPNPSQLNEDAFTLGFAPPPKRQDVASGRNSPSIKGDRPYSPAVSPHVPLVSVFDELPVLMAPHSLRKSSTYTALDFAPPKKFREGGDAMSDAGSIRSNKGGLNTQALQQNIRAGAYRVSRIPQEVVPYKDDMTAHLRPTMDLSKR